MNVSYSGTCECGRTVRRGFDPDEDSQAIDSNAPRRIRCEECRSIVLCDKDSSPPEVQHG